MDDWGRYDPRRPQWHQGLDSNEHKRESCTRNSFFRRRLGRVERAEAGELREFAISRSVSPTATTTRAVHVTPRLTATTGYILRSRASRRGHCPVLKLRGRRSTRRRAIYYFTVEVVASMAYLIHCT